jgi:tetratricopeptide (TPR) repeat protein
LDAASRYAEARQAYVAAKESDPLRFRAPEVMNVIIREAAAAHGAEVVEMQQAFRENSPAGLIGRTLMLEHLHPNLKGYRLMADVFYDVLKRLDVFGGHTEAEVRAGQYPTYSVIDSLAGMYRIQRLMGGWPFKPAGTVNRVLDTLSVETPLEELGMDLTHEVRSWENATEELLSYYGSQGDRIGVLHTARILAQAFPFNHSPHLVTGHVLVQLGRFDEALSEFETAYALEATVEAGKMVGILLLQQGEVETAIDYLERALAARPDDDEIQFRLGSGYMMNRQFDEARRTIQRLLERNPDHQGGRNLLTVLPAVSG